MCQTDCRLDLLPSTILNNMIFDNSTVSDEPLFYVTPRHSQKPQDFGFQLISTGEANQRLEACNGCEFFRKQLKQCSICNCIMPVKVRFKKSSCPDGRW